MIFHDLPGVLICLFLAPGIFIAPGYVSGDIADLLEFRTSSFAKRVLISLALSLAVSPVLAFLCWRTGSAEIGWGVFGLLNGMFLLMLLRDSRRIFAECLNWKWKSAISVAAFVVAFVVTMVLSLVDVEIDGGLYPAISTHDTVKHVFVADAISRTGVPPVNPVFSDGKSVPLFYYYHWFILPSLVDQLAGPYAGAREAVTACTVWTALSLLSMLILYIRTWHMTWISDSGLSVRIGMMLLTVMGFDLIPYLWDAVRLKFNLSLDWWAADQVTAWSNIVLWVPHHLGAFIACFVGFLLLDQSVRSGKFSLPTNVVAGAAFASALGQSIWVGVTGAIILGSWFLRAIVTRDWKEILPHLISAGFTLLFALPFVYDLQQAGHSESSPIALHVRHMDFAETVISTLSLANPAIKVIVYIVMLPLFYIAELGFVLIAGLLYWRHRRSLTNPLTRQERFLQWSTIIAFLISTFLRSAIVNNDFGWRASMFVQFPLVLWSIPVLQDLRNENRLRLSGNVKSLLKIALVLGVLGTIAELVLHRTTSEGERGPIALQLRKAYLWIEGNTPKEAVIQHNPYRNFEFLQGSYTYRQTAVVDYVYGGLFGINAEMLKSVIEPCTAMFSTHSSVSQVLETCDRFKITVLVVQSVDPIWQDEKSWARRCPAAYEDADVRVILVSDLKRWQP
ncbi:MAG: hypothetical protein ACRC8S_06580 [Fimbriiglobus sp.]